MLSKKLLKIYKDINKNITVIYCGNRKIDKIKNMFEIILNIYLFVR